VHSSRITDRNGNTCNPNSRLAFTHTHTLSHTHAHTGAHQVVQYGDGEIEHAHLDRLCERSVQAEQGLGFHAERTAQQHAKNIKGEEEKRESPRAVCSLLDNREESVSEKGTTTTTEEPLRRLTPPLPLPPPLPPPLPSHQRTLHSPLFPLSSSSFLTVSSCSLSLSGRYCPTSSVCLKPSGARKKKSSQVQKKRERESEREREREVDSLLLEPKRARLSV